MAQIKAEIRTSESLKFVEAMTERQLAMVYGGANNGLMGAVADHMLALGGEVTGVIPQHFVGWELAHAGLSELISVDSMPERKQRMAALADGFVALPGGIGTLEEIIEMISWAQLGIHHKPCALLNINGYYDPLLAFFDHSLQQGLMRPRLRDMILTDSDPNSLLDRILAYESPVTHHWAAN